MKNILLALFIGVATLSYAQVPQQISYQGVARNTTGTVYANQPIGIKLDLHQGSAGGTVVFSETHTKTTNSFGLFTLGIGSVNSGVFSSINWSAGPYFLEVSIDPAGGTSYSSVGTQQFMSVPYALYAETSGNAGSTPTITINAPNTVSSAAGSYSITVPAQTLSLNSNSLSISNGNTVVLPSSTTYSAGPGIDISGTGVITGTANIVGTGATTVTGTYPNLTINTPTTQVYTAGPGIDISTLGVISNTATAVTPTITGVGSATVISSGNTFTVNTPALTSPTITSTGIAVVTPTTGNVFNVDVPVPVLSYTPGTSVLSISQGTTVSTATLVGSGTNTIDIVGSGLATVTPTTGSTFTVSVPNPTLTINSGSLSISNGNTVALPEQSLSLNSNSLTISGTGGNTVVLPSASTTTLTQGNNINLTGTAPNYTVSAVTPTLTGAGTTTVTGTYPSYTVSSASSPSTSISSGTNVVVSGAYPNYTVSSSTPTLSVIGGTLTGTYPTQTLTIPTQTTYVGTANNISVTSNTINLVPTGVATANYGSNASNAVPTFSVDTYGRLATASQYTPSISGDVLGSINTSTVVRLQGVPVSTIAPTANQMLKLIGGVWTPTTAVQTASYVSQGVANVINAAPLYTINVPMSTYNNNTGVFSTGAFTIAVTPTLSLAGNVLRSGPTTNTVSLPTPTVVSGNSNITVTPSGNTYSVSAVTPTLSVTGGVLTGAYPSQTLTIPTSSTTVLSSTNIAITGTAPNYTLSSPSQSLSINSNSLSITGANTVIIPTSSVVAGNANITVTPSGNTYSVSTPNYSISLPGGNVVQITNGVNTSTAAIATTSLTLTGVNNNILSAGGNTVGLNTYTPGTGVAITGTAPNYTISSPSQSLSINSNSISITGGNTITIPTSSTTVITPSTNISIAGTAPNYTISSPSQSLTINSNSLSITGGNTITIPTSTISGIGTGIATVTTSANNFTVNVPAPTYTAGTGVLSFGGTNTVVVTPTLSLTGTTLTSGPATNSVNLSGFNGIYGGSGSIQTGSTTVTVGTNTLTFLSGNTANKPIANFFGGGITGTSMTLGHVGANSANFKFIGSATTTPVDYGYVSGSTNGISISGGTSTNGFYATNSAEVGVGSYTTGTGKFVITHTASQANPTMHLRETSGGLSRIKFSNNTVANKFFETAAQTNAVDANGAYSINYFDGATYKPVLLVTGDKKVNINNLNTVLGSLHVMENSTTAGNGIISEGFAQAAQLNLARNNQPALAARTAVVAGDELGRINFAGYDGAAFGDGAKIYAKAAENVTGSNKGTELIFAAVPTGTNSNKDAFKINGTGNLEVISGLRIPLGAVAGHVLTSDATGNASWQPGAGLSPWIQGASIVTLANIGDKVGIGTNAPMGALDVTHNVAGVPAFIVNSNAITNTDGIRVVQAGTGNGLFSGIYNASSPAKAIEAQSGGVGVTLGAANSGTGGAGDFQIINAASNAIALTASSNGGGTVIYASNTNSTNTAAVIQANSNSSGVAIYGTNSNGATSQFDNFSSSAAMNAINYNTGNAINATASSGRAINASSSGSTTPTANFSNSNSGDVIMSFAGTGRAIYAQTGANGMATSELTNTGTGPVVFAYKNAGTTGGVVANYANNSNTNPADVVLSYNNGVGAAVHAANNPSNLSSALSLWVENGHIKATGTNATSSTTVTSISTSTVIGNDVVGKISITTVATAIPANQEMIKVQFAKSYPAGVTPNVIITPSNANAAGVQGYVSTVSNTGFSIFFNVGTAAIVRTYTFNYMVIE
jgi:hypothetical protein